MTTPTYFSPNQLSPKAPQLESPTDVASKATFSTAVSTPYSSNGSTPHQYRVTHLQLTPPAQPTEMQDKKPKELFEILQKNRESENGEEINKELEEINNELKERIRQAVYGSILYIYSGSKNIASKVDIKLNLLLMKQKLITKEILELIADMKISTTCSEKTLPLMLGIQDPEVADLLFAYADLGLKNNALAFWSKRYNERSDLFNALGFKEPPVKYQSEDNHDYQGNDTFRNDKEIIKKPEIILGWHAKNRNKLIKVILKNGADVRSCPAGIPLLHQCEEYLAFVLFHYKADPKQLDGRGNTALHSIVKKGYSQEALSLYLYESPELLNMTNDQQQTALHIAILNEKWGLVRFLLNINANAFIKDKAGQTACALIKDCLFKRSSLLHDASNPKLVVDLQRHLEDLRELLNICQNQIPPLWKRIAACCCCCCKKKDRVKPKRETTRVTVHREVSYRLPRLDLTKQHKQQAQDEKHAKEEHSSENADNANLSNLDVVVLSPRKPIPAAPVPANAAPQPTRQAYTDLQHRGGLVPTPDSQQASQNSLQPDLNTLKPAPSAISQSSVVSNREENKHPYDPNAQIRNPAVASPLGPPMDPILATAQPDTLELAPPFNLNNS